MLKIWFLQRIFENGEQFMRKKLINAVLTGLFFLYFFYCVHFLYKNSERNQWDFQMQYTAAKVFSEGENPYKMGVINTFTGNALWYAYPPATLWFYRLFTFFEYETAYKIFLFVKTAVIIGLFVLWRFKFVQKQAGPGFFYFALLVFNSTIFLDMRAGNINMLEQLMIWLGFYFFLQRRLLLFCIFILIASTFKMTPAAFLVLLFTTDNKNKYLYFLRSCAVFAGYLFVQYIFQPEMLLEFFKGAQTTLTEWGIIAPSTVGVLKDLCDMLNRNTGIALSSNVQLAVFGVIALIILFISSRAYFKLKNLNTDEKQKMILFLACLVYALLHVRMKDYAYALLIVPSYYIINRTSYAKIYPLLFFVSILAAARLTLPLLMDIYAIMWAYYPLVIAYLIWGLYINEIFTLAKNPAQEYKALQPDQT